MTGRQHGNIEIRRVPVSEILDLRWRILREGLPFESARFEGDETPTTIHFAALDLTVPDTDPLCCASFMVSFFEGEEAWQLRGMATTTRHQGHGLGGQLLREAEQVLTTTSHVRLLWCNARKAAIPFYLRHGWEIMSGEFEIEGAGPHRKMIKHLR